MSFLEFSKKFSTEQTCIQHFIKIRYKSNKPYCNHCGCSKAVYSATHNKKAFICHSCKSSFSVFAGTIFEKSDTDLRKWFYAINLILNGKKAISGYQLQKEIGVTYKCAWRMLKKIREAMDKDDANDTNAGNILKGLVRR